MNKKKRRQMILAFVMCLLICLVCVVLSCISIMQTKNITTSEQATATTDESTTIEIIPTTVEPTTVAIVKTTATTETIEESVTEASEPEIEEYDDDVEDNAYYWSEEVLSPDTGRINGPSGEETYYNLDMSWCVSMMKSVGYEYEEYVREDGVKMFGPYVMCAANLDIRPKGTILPSSLGMAIVVDTGGFAEYNPYQLDIAVAW